MDEYVVRSVQTQLPPGVGSFSSVLAKRVVKFRFKVASGLGPQADHGGTQLNAAPKTCGPSRAKTIQYIDSKLGICVLCLWSVSKRMKSQTKTFNNRFVLSTISWMSDDAEYEEEEAGRLPVQAR